MGLVSQELHDGPGAVVDDDRVVLFESPRARRSFSPGDVVRLVLGVGLVFGGGLLADAAQSTIQGLEADLLRALGLLPDPVEDSLLATSQILTSVVPTLVLVVLLVKRRYRLGLLLVAAFVMSTAGMVIADAVIFDAQFNELLEKLGNDQDQFLERVFPESRGLASATAVVTVAAPFLARRWKRTLWWMIGGLVFLRLLAVNAPAFDFVLALGVGTMTGSILLLVFGSPLAEPGPRELLDALRSAGFDPRRIDRPEQSGFALHYDVVDADGAEYDVSLRTPDERDADLLGRLYRRLRYRSSEVDTPFGNLKRRIEHEALLSTLAHRAGVRTADVARIGTTDGGSAFLVRSRIHTRPATPEDLDDEDRLDDLWEQLEALHDAGIAHRGLSLEALSVDRHGSLWLARFASAQTAPGERERARDVAQLLTETALVVGPRRAVESAVRSMGPARVAPALRMLQLLALPASTRARAKEAGRLLEDLRDEVNTATGEPGLELEDLERVKPRTLVIVGISALAFYSLLPQLASLDATLEAFGDAQIAWILVVILSSALTYVFAAISFQGAVPHPLPFLPNLRAQVATSFVGLVGPAGAGGFALTARFLERAGVRAAEAGASVAVNALAGAFVHIAMMIGFFLWAGSSDLGEFSFPGASTVVLVVAIGFTVVGLAVTIGPVRRRFVPRMVDSFKSSLSQIALVFQNPGRVLALFGGSTGITTMYVVGIVASVHAFGGGLSVPQIAAGYLGAMALGNLSPTPGGLGAIESAMVAAFTAFGLDVGIAVSATLTFRLATFWLPIVPGWAAMGWMQRDGEL
ncbi:MAG: lysylphosphatidylglycerol synthase transmembrane domain-containing protein [Acidimicrobiales bacterium]|nr:lysylphosphatidylglycerol synthase transmembrane domain-containing protein [Acidimicrobiales bacterium]